MAAGRGDFEEIAGRAVMAGHSASEDARERAYDPAIHPLRKNFSPGMMDPRVKPAGDDVVRGDFDAIADAYIVFAAATS
jgi:hypothetical protein